MAVIHPVCPECKRHVPITLRVVRGKIERRCWECWSKVDGKPHPMLVALQSGNVGRATWNTHHPKNEVKK